MTSLPSRLYDAYRMNALDQLRAETADVDLPAPVRGWQAWLATGSGRIPVTITSRTSAP